MRKTWEIVDGVIIAPNGWTWRTQELIGARQDEIEQRVRLPAAWTGWRMQGGVLVPKHRRFQIRPSGSGSGQRAVRRVARERCGVRARERF